MTPERMVWWFSLYRFWWLLGSAGANDVVGHDAA
jgi:hypothetical protein